MPSPVLLAVKHTTALPVRTGAAVPVGITSSLAVPHQLLLQTIMSAIVHVCHFLFVLSLRVASKYSAKLYGTPASFIQGACYRIRM